MSPVALSNESPSGRLGETDHESTFPVIVGVRSAIVSPTVNTFGVVYESADGAASLTVISISNDTLPPVFVAVTVSVSVDETSPDVHELLPHTGANAVVRPK